MKIQLNKNVFIYDSKWNWTENSEFLKYNKLLDVICDYLTTEPSFYRIFIFVFPQQFIFREYEADLLTIIITDFLIKYKYLSLNNLINKCINVINNKYFKDKSSKFNIHLVLMEKLCFLGNMGVISINFKSKMQ